MGMFNERCMVTGICLYRVAVVLVSEHGEQDGVERRELQVTADEERALISGVLAALGATAEEQACVAEALGRDLLEVPVGFKWFVPGLLDGSVAFGGEESAGASFLRKDGTVWTTDKDGILLCLLAAEILAVTGKTPSQRYAELEAEFGASAYQRVDAPATPAQKAALAKLAPEAVTATELAGEPITAKLSHAPGNGAAIGGLKVQTELAWFAARPSGTEDVYKLYAESLRGPEHLAEVQAEARAVVSAALGG